MFPFAAGTGFPVLGPLIRNPAVADVGPADHRSDVRAFSFVEAASSVRRRQYGKIVLRYTERVYRRADNRFRRWNRGLLHSA